jgi:hypothetical protein
MGILAPAADERVRNVSIDDDTLSVSLIDGRTITANMQAFLVPQLKYSLKKPSFIHAH